MKINYFNYKLIEIWDSCKEDMGWSCARASKSIASAFQIELSDIIKVVEKRADEIIEEWFSLGDLVFGKELGNPFRQEKDSEAYLDLKKYLLRNWKSKKEFKIIKDELEYLKDPENVFNFIDKLENLRK